MNYHHTQTMYNPFCCLYPFSFKPRLCLLLMCFMTHKKHAQCVLYFIIHCVHNGNFLLRGLGQLRQIWRKVTVNMVDSYGKYGGKFQHEKWPVMFSFSHALVLQIRILTSTKQPRKKNQVTIQPNNGKVSFLIECTIIKANNQKNNLPTTVYDQKPSKYMINKFLPFSQPSINCSINYLISKPIKQPNYLQTSSKQLFKQIIYQLFDQQTS